jgi:hypothetical protein
MAVAGRAEWQCMIRMILSWILTVPIVVFLTWSASFRFVDPIGLNPVFAELARNTHWSFFEPQLRIFFGALEAVTALLLLVPTARRFAACVAAILFAALVALHVSPLLGFDVDQPMAYGFVPWLQEFLPHWLWNLVSQWFVDRLPETSRASFYAACCGLGLSLVVLLVHPQWTTRGMRSPLSAKVPARDDGDDEQIPFPSESL